ncbi:tetratricopeptide repeat protein [Mariniflexile sp. HNIBRBA6329]|uniref:ATP-binding protein n=1 Tax=Mariniflexile sp. HNIBRBA6329 TaxID=3373088 RepID=UPI003744DE19
MKVIKTSFLFFCLYLASFVLTNGTNLYAQEKTDSLNYYYKLSLDTTQSIPTNLLYANKLIDLSIKKNNVYYRLNGLNRKSYLHSKQGDFNTAISTAKRLLKESKKAQDSSNLLLAYRKLADYSRLSDSLLNAYSYYQEHKALNVLFRDSLGIIRDLRFMSSIQYKLGLLYESESTAVEAITLLDHLNESSATTDAKVGLYNHLGIIYKEIGNYDRALEHYNKLLSITKNIHYLNIIHGNVANVYKEQGNYNLALVEFKKVYENSIKSNNNKEIARALNNLAFVKSKLNYPEALSEMKKALEIRKKENDYSDLFSSYVALAEHFTDRNNKIQAKIYSNKAYEISLKTKNKLDRLKALSFIVELENGAKIREYKNLTDSIATAKQNNENKFAYIKYNYNKKEKEAQEIKIKYIQSELKVAKEKSNKTIYQSVTLMVLMLTIFLYFIIKSRHKKEKLQEVYITESRISKKVHDEVANDVYHIMTKLQSDKSLKENILDDLEHVYFKTRDISKENSILDVHEDYNELLKDLLLSYKNDSINVITQNISKIDWNTLTELKKMTLFRVLQELMTNMRKHSYASLVVLSFKTSGKTIIIDYKDNGVGCNLIKHNGLRNTENRMASINGTITFESEPGNGFKVQITV